jgi:hypothetical protein
VRRPVVIWSIGAAAAALLVAGVLLRPSGLSDTGWLLPIAAPFLAVGTLLAWRRPDNRVAWLFFAFGVTTSVDFFAYQWAYRAAVDHAMGGANLAVTIAGHLWHPSFELLVLAFLVFPNGALLSPRWRWVAAGAIANGVILLVLSPFESGFVSQEFADAEPLWSNGLTPLADGAWNVLLPLTLLFLLLAGASLVIRLRRSHGQERQQIKWFVLPIALIILAFPLLFVIFGDAYGVLLFPLIPVSAAVAVLKYRLYDIDVVVNRTLVYAALTATLAAAYLLCVLLLQFALDSVTSGSSLAVAVSTLAVAALFRPARARIQGVVDRRFYRRKYDATLTLERFAARLRHEVDLEALGNELRAVVAQTMQPVHVSLWLRP